jgi:hypothetical protein
MPSCSTDMHTMYLGILFISRVHILLNNTVG